MSRVLRTGLIVALFAATGTGMFALYNNQKSLVEAQDRLVGAFELARQNAHKKEVQVVERVVAQQPWAGVQKGLKDTVVRIISQTAEVNLLQPYKTPKQGGGFGTGFFISEDGYIITNHHVIDEAIAIWIKIPSLGKAIIDVELVGTSPERDLALLRVKPEGLAYIKEQLGGIQYLTLGDSDFVSRSDEVLALGYPLGGSQTAIKSTSGVVSGREHIGGRHLIQISAPINPGSSGGPALSLDGHVIGISCAGIMEAQSIGYIIPVNELKLILDDLLKTGILRRPFLGVLFNNGSPELTEYLHNPLPGGCYVVDVYSGSPLSKAGVKPGDMIYEINGHTIDYYGDLTVPWSEDKVSVIDYVARLEIGQVITVMLYRKGAKKEFKFKFDFSELLPVHKIFPGYDKIEYEMFGGMLLQPLCLNHLPILINHSPSLAKYMDFENQTKPALIVTHVVPNSQVQRLEMLREGAIVTEINNKEITTLEELRTELKRSVHKDFITFKTSDGVFFVVSPEKVFKDEKRLSENYHYELSPFMQELLAMHDQNKVKKGNG